jgi:hypothetical protein
MSDLTVHNLEGKFEPQAKTITTSISDAALVSIAVSIKRIADEMRFHRPPQPRSYEGRYND